MATVTSVTGVPGYFPGAALTITGSGMGAPGRIFLVFPTTGFYVYEYEDLTGVSWTAGSISGPTILIPEIGEDLSTDFIGQDFYVAVLPAGSVVGARSPDYTLAASTVVNTTIPIGTVVRGIDVSPAAPICQPFGGQIGFVNGFDNPGYEIEWYSTANSEQVYESVTSTNSEIGISPLGTSVLQAVAAFGYTFSTESGS